MNVFNVVKHLSLPLGIICWCISCREKETVPSITFRGNSTQLKATEVVACLSDSVSSGNNIIWSASFGASWKALEDFSGEAVIFDGNPEIAKCLNSARDPREYLPSGAAYSAVGWMEHGITERIRGDLHRQFPQKQPPQFGGISSSSLVAYAYIESELPFRLRYDQNPQPLVFTEAGGKKSTVKSFGIVPALHSDRRDKLYQQPRVLFRKGSSRDGSFEFAVDLCSDSDPAQIVVARIAREPTLGMMLTKVEKEIERMPERMKAEPEAAGLSFVEDLLRVQSGDSLLIPDMYWIVSHRFREIEKSQFGNQKLRGLSLDVAQEEILFRVNRTGAVLRSESKRYGTGFPAEFSMDRPYLIYLKKRDSSMPYCAMWVENAELLSPWQTVSR